LSPELTATLRHFQRENQKYPVATSGNNGAQPSARIRIA
jgi:hypothetical protein